ncbi:MAG: hypothetical protein V3W45_03720, partial [Sedimentisphaerales bacterium]
PFMQNKANFRKSQMNVNLYNTTDYEEKCNWTLGENKPNQSQLVKTGTRPKIQVLSLKSGVWNGFFCKGVAIWSMIGYINGFV